MKKKTKQLSINENLFVRFLQNPRLVILSLFILVVAAFINSLPNDFTYDDIPYIRDNKYITSLKYLPEIFTKTYPPHSPELCLYRPLVELSYMIDYSLGLRRTELEPYGFKPEISTVPFHITNILLHFLITVLVYIIGMRLFPQMPALTFFAVAFFAVHPVHVEVVASLVGRAESLTTLFFLFSLYMVIVSPLNLPYWSGRRLLAYGLFFCALLSKETAITLPLIVLIYLWTFRREELKKLAVIHKEPLFLLLFMLPYLAVFILYLLIRVKVVGVIGIREVSTYFYMHDDLKPLPSMLIVFLAYVKLMILPDVLHIDYNFPLPIVDKIQIPAPASVFEPLPLIGLILLVSWLVWGGILLLRRSKLSLLFLWFLITLFPVSNIIPFGDIMAERFLYLPSVGFCWLAGWVFAGARNPETYTRENSFRKVKTLSLVIFSLVLVALLVRTIYRNVDWRDSIRLWKAVERIDPNNEAVYYSLGHSYYELSRYHLERSNVYNQLGRGELAKYHRELARKYEQMSIEHYRESIKRQPHIFEAYHNLVLALIDAETPQLEEALKLAKYLAHSKNPQYFKDLDEFNYNVGNIYTRMGKFENAIPYYLRAIRLDPKEMKYYNDLGAAYASIGKLDVAEKIWRYILKQDPLHEAAESNLKKLTALKKRYGTLPIPPGQEFKFAPPNAK